MDGSTALAILDKKINSVESTVQSVTLGSDKKSIVITTVDGVSFSVSIPNAVDNPTILNKFTVVNGEVYYDGKRIAEYAEIPTATSQLTNDSGFITSANLPNLTPYQPKNDSDLNTTNKTVVGAINELKTNINNINVPTKTSQLTNDSDFITNNDINGKADKSYVDEKLSEKQNKIIAGANITISGNVVSAIVPTKTSDLTNDYNFITNNDIINKADKSEIPTKTSDLTNDSNFITNNDIVGKADKSYVDEKLSKKQDIITGNSGEVVYHNGSNVFTQQILNEGFVCPTEEDVNICKNNSPSFSDVFNTWKKFSHLNGNDNAITSEINAWTYDSGKDTIIQPLNTSSYVGFISPKSYSSYDITVRCYSTGTDNDTIGLVAAFATDSNNKQHTLSFLRSPGGTSASWVCLLDYNNFALTSTSYGQTMIVNKSSSTTSNNSNWNTTTIGTGTVINMTRNGNILSAVCSQFNSSVLDEKTRINVDLDELSATYPTLSLFKGSSPWGYSNFSQPNSMYENIAVTDPDGYIFDIPNNKVLRYDNSKKDWTTVSGQTPISSLGAGRLSYNKITGKLFYCNGSSIFQIATNN